MEHRITLSNAFAFVLWHCGMPDPNVMTKNPRLGKRIHTHHEATTATSTPHNRTSTVEQKQH